MLPRLDLYCKYPAHYRITAGYDLDDLLIDRDLSDLSVRRFNSTRQPVPDRSGGAFTRTCFLGCICTIRTDPAQHLITAGYDLDDLLIDRDLSDLSVRRVNCLHGCGS